MIIYDWKKVWQKSEGSSSRILDIISYLTHAQVPKDIYDPILRFVDVDWRGISYLVNPEPVFEHRVRMYEKELAEYVALASFRNLADYKVTKRTTLPLMESPIDAESINNNRFLLLRDDGLIHFRWEEPAN